MKNLKQFNLLVPQKKILPLKKCQYTRKKYQNLSEEENYQKHQYCRERYKNLSEYKKQRLVKYRGNYFITLKYDCKIAQ